MALGELKNGIGPDAYAIYQQVLAAVVERDHPVGSLYISENPTSPAELFGGTWERIEDCTIWGASDTHPAGTRVEAGLPNIEGTFAFGNDGTSAWVRPISSDGCFDYEKKGTAAIYTQNGGTQNVPVSLKLEASKSNQIYGASNTVQPPAYCVYIWRRVA